MKEFLETKRMPEWLKKINKDNFSNSFNLGNILEDSVYYPGAGIDALPIEIFSGYAYSFIYVDYAMGYSFIKNRLTGKKGKDFKGYHLIGIKDISREELIPFGWEPYQSLMFEDGDPKKFLHIIEKPYAIWAVYERDKEYDDYHGGKRFSLLYICGDGVASYDALYCTNQIAPLAIAFIQIFGFSGNWANFSDEEGIMARLVLYNSFNKSPKYLIYGGWKIENNQEAWDKYRKSFQKPFWGEYSVLIGEAENYGHYATVWEKYDPKNPKHNDDDDEFDKYISEWISKYK